MLLIAGLLAALSALLSARRPPKINATDPFYDGGQEVDVGSALRTLLCTTHA